MTQIYLDLWDDEEFLEWYNERPPAIQDIIRRFPPWRLYCIHGESFPARIYSYDEEEDGIITMKVDIMNPLFPRRVFGIKPEDIEVWTDE